MSESKFTPGPYLRDGTCVYKLGAGGANIFAAQVSSGYDDHGGRTSTEECEAVAQLMQVAPELLEALIDTQAALAHCRADIGYSKMQSAAVRKAHYAIQRATSSPMGKE